MAIPDVNVIKERVKQVVVLGATNTSMILEFDIVNIDTQEILASGQMSQGIPNDGLGQRGRVRARLFGQVRDVVRLHRQRNKARPDLAGYSVRDVSPWLDNWKVLCLNPNTNRFRLEHPTESTQVCNVYFNDEADLSSGWPTEKALAAKLLTYFLPGPLSVGAVSPGAGQLIFTCATVTGASAYRWYDADGNLLDESASNSGSASGLAAATYQVRAAAVDGSGIVGLFSEPITVIVE